MTCQNLALVISPLPLYSISGNTFKESKVSVHSHCYVHVHLHVNLGQYTIWERVPCCMAGSSSQPLIKRASSCTIFNISISPKIIPKPKGAFIRVESITQRPKVDFSWGGKYRKSLFSLINIFSGRNHTKISFTNIISQRTWLVENFNQFNLHKNLLTSCKHKLHVHVRTYIEMIATQVYMYVHLWKLFNTQYHALVLSEHAITWQTSTNYCRWGNFLCKKFVNGHLQQQNLNRKNTFFWRINGLSLYCQVVIVMKMKPGKNFIDEIFYHWKIPNLRYTVYVQYTGTVHVRALFRGRVGER